MARSQKINCDALELIRTHYRELGPTKLARRVGVSPSTIAHYAKQMGLVKPMTKQPHVPTHRVAFQWDPIFQFNNYTQKPTDDPTPDEIRQLTAHLREQKHQEGVFCKTPPDVDRRRTCHLEVR